MEGENKDVMEAHRLYDQLLRQQDEIERLRAAVSSMQQRPLLGPANPYMRLTDTSRRNAAAIEQLQAQARTDAFYVCDDCAAAVSYTHLTLPTILLV